MSCRCNEVQPAIGVAPQQGVCACLLVDEALSWQGTPWQHQQRLKGIGVDCIGLVLASLRAVGAIAADHDLGEWERVDYARNPRGDALLQVIARHCVRLAEPQPGALLVFRLAGQVRHVGLYVGDRGQGETFVHASPQAGGVVEVGYRMQWVKWTAAVFALPGIGYGVSDGR